MLNKMDLFKYFPYEEIYRKGNHAPQSRTMTNLTVSFGCCYSFPPTPLFFETGNWCQPCEYFSEKFLDYGSGEVSYNQPSFVTLKPSQASGGPLDLRMKKSFHIDNLTSNLAPPSIRTNYADQRRTSQSNNIGQSEKRKDHSINSFLPFVDKKISSDAKNELYTPLNLKICNRDVTEHPRQTESIKTSRDKNDGCSHLEIDSVPQQPTFIQAQHIATESKTESRDSIVTPLFCKSPSSCKPQDVDVIKCHQVGCHKTFHSKGALTIHAHRFHSCGTARDEIRVAETKQKKCSQRQKQRRSRDKPNGKTLLCSYQGCGKSFKEMKHLKVHQMQHTDDRPLACQICSYKCRQRNSMNWHMKAKHGHDKKVTQEGKTIYLRREDASRMSSD